MGQYRLNWVVLGAVLVSVFGSLAMFGPEGNILFGIWERMVEVFRELNLARWGTAWEIAIKREALGRLVIDG